MAMCVSPIGVDCRPRLQPWQSPRPKETEGDTSSLGERSRASRAKAQVGARALFDKKDAFANAVHCAISIVDREIDGQDWGHFLIQLGPLALSCPSGCPQAVGIAVEILRLTFGEK